MDRQQALMELEQTLKRWTASPHGRRHFIASLPLLLAACSSAPRHRQREGDNTGQQAALTVKEERKMAREYRPKMLQEYPLHKDAQAQNYLQNLGDRITRANGLQGRPYRYQFRVVKTDMVNAFALPAGAVFVTAPLFTMAESEAELAGVVGHEIGHIKARHTAERLHKAKQEEGKSLWYALGGGLLGGAAGFGLGRLLCQKRDRECLARAATYGAAAGTAGGLLIQKFAFMAHSREDEMEADRVGFRTSVAAGFHKDYVGQFYEKLLLKERQFQKKQSHGLKPLTDAMSTHPPSEQRVTQMKALAAQASVPGHAIINGREFERIKKRLA